jgi:type IV secretory pathway VirB9-like protein
MYFDNPVNLASAKIDKSIQILRSGLQPAVLAYWYKQIEYQSIEKVEQELKDKICFEQDRILWMKFKINISIRAIPIVLETIENNISLMEYSTGLYFRKIQDILLQKLNDSTVIINDDKKKTTKNTKSKKQKAFNRKKRI